MTDLATLSRALLDALTHSADPRERLCLVEAALIRYADLCIAVECGCGPERVLASGKKAT